MIYVKSPMEMRLLWGPGRSVWEKPTFSCLLYRKRGNVILLSALHLSFCPLSVSAVNFNFCPVFTRINSQRGIFGHLNESQEQTPALGSQFVQKSFSQHMGSCLLQAHFLWKISFPTYFTKLLHCNFWWLICHEQVDSVLPLPHTHRLRFLKLPSYLPRRPWFISIELNHVLFLQRARTIWNQRISLTRK